MEHIEIKKIIEELLRRMGMSLKSVEDVSTLESSHKRFLVDSEDSGLLIGANGENLEALNYIVRRIVGRGTKESLPVKFIVDVNGYHEKTLEGVRTKAKVMLERARSFKVDIELEPMTSYERMLVHSSLESERDIKTESKGEGRSRRVVIKYLG